MSNPMKLHEISEARYHAVHAEQIAKGLDEYGEPLKPFNGRDAAHDCRAELADALDYLTQLEMERDHWREEVARLHNEMERLREVERDYRRMRQAWLDDEIKREVVL